MAREPIERAIKRISPDVTSKADKARILFRQGDGDGGEYSTSEVSKALGMAYSQAHSVRKSLGQPPKAKPTPSERITKRLARPMPVARSGYKHQAEDLETIAKRDVPTARQLAKSAKVKKTGVTARVGKLRTPGHPTDIDVGVCANCGFDLVVRKGPPQYVLVHVNVTAEEYLAITQFCMATPEVLLA